MRYRQPQHGPFRPSAYWLSRGLQLVFVGNRAVWNRDQPSTSPSLSAFGGPKSVTHPGGVAQGFGGTYGTGPTDYLSGPKLRAPANNTGRSIVARVYANSTGGGGLGRISQDISGSGLTKGESFYLSTVPGITFAITDASSTLYHTWTPSFTPPTGRWCTLGISVPFSTTGATTARGFLDGAFKASAANAGSLSTVSNVPTDLAFGNRPAAPGNERYFDGMLDVILYFDEVLSDSDHALLAANPMRVFEDSAFRLWAVTAGPPTHTLTGAATTQDAASGTAAIAQVHALSAAGVAQAATSGAGVVSQVQILVGSGSSQAMASGAGALVQTQVLVGAAATQDATSGTAIAGQAHVLAGSPASQSATSSGGAVSQVHSLSGAGCAQDGASGTGAISVGSVATLVGADAAQSATAGSGAITQAHALIAAPSVQDSLASASAIVQAHVLVAAACSQAAASSSAAVTQQASSYAISATRANLLYQTALLHGLDVAHPLNVSATERSAGELVQTIEGTDMVTITTISAPPLSGSLDDWVDGLAAIHGLTAPLVVTSTSRSAGALAQSIENAGGVTVVTTA